MTMAAVRRGTFTAKNVCRALLRYAMMAERGVAYGRSASSLQTRYSGTIKKNLKAKTLVIPKVSRRGSTA